MEIYSKYRFRWAILACLWIFAWAAVFKDDPGEIQATDIVAGKHDARFRPPEQENFNFGFSAAVFWVRIVVQNPEGRPVPWRLEFKYPHVREIIRSFIRKPVTRRQMGRALSAVFRGGRAGIGPGPAVADSPADTPPECLKGKTALLAEDNLINQQVAAEILAAAGREVSDITAALNELADLISKNNPKADIYFEKTKSLLRDPQIQKQVETLDRRLKSFEFKGAREALLDMAGGLGVKLTSDQ